eukprot:scaffold187331_cov63-Attheya_sp.AAC.3
MVCSSNTQCQAAKSCKEDYRWTLNQCWTWNESSNGVPVPCLKKSTTYPRRVVSLFLAATSIMKTIHVPWLM